ncbi:LytR C-terminal domain-containing protein [Streptomyces litchfieldiae]|uniref:LytR C-terminal domain-containing protein n=1 Tax=Streptomyces litchfieldiae TaxID=3075543 RepID=A0ABU2MK65_9ACTN|nr:LytR C-terminal domain-containing protein [Streptomyces sp. DSM 44938]MDT0342006.1 LytR C-terminal domain-containing protein [Streptomyces sp. DSM 44938]
MSMLTPPGMGGKKFRVTGDRYPRMRPRRRRGRLVFLLVAAVTVLSLIGYGTLQLIDVFSGDDDGGRAPRAQSGARPDQDCAPPARDTRTNEPSAPPEPAAITVNVYNATDRTGLAQETADALAERGFTIGKVENAPRELDGQVTSPGLLLGATAAEESGALSVLATQLDGAENGEPLALEEGADPATVVDLVIGDGFTELTAADEAQRRLDGLASPAADASAPAC